MLTQDPYLTKKKQNKKPKPKAMFRFKSSAFESGDIKARKGQLNMMYSITANRTTRIQIRKGTKHVDNKQINIIIPINKQYKVVNPQTLKVE